MFRLCVFFMNRIDIDMKNIRRIWLLSIRKLWLSHVAFAILPHLILDEVCCCCCCWLLFYSFAWNGNNLSVRQLLPFTHSVHGCVCMYLSMHIFIVIVLQSLCFIQAMADCHCARTILFLCSIFLVSISKYNLFIQHRIFEECQCMHMLPFISLSLVRLHSFWMCV